MAPRDDPEGKWTIQPELGSLIKDCLNPGARSYRLVKVLGKGGMGCVYLGVDERSGEEVGIKLLLPTVKDPNVIRLFEEEMKVLAALFVGAQERVPYIVEFKDHGIFQHSQYFLVMEYLHGVSLQRYAHRRFREKKTGFTELEIFRIVDCMAKGLNHAHRHGIYHRDLKPANVLIDAEFRAYLLDFGLAKLLRTPNLLPPGTIVGTPLYMSPEQAIGAELDHLSDIYSFGLIIYELLTGTLPLLAKNPMKTAQRRVHEDCPPPSTVPNLLRPVSPAMDEIVMRCLARDKRKRFQLASDVALSMRMHLQNSRMKTAARSSLDTSRAPETPATQPPAPPRQESTVERLDFPRKDAVVKGLLDATKAHFEQAARRCSTLGFPYSSTLATLDSRKAAKYESWLGRGRANSEEAMVLHLVFRERHHLLLRFVGHLLKGKLELRSAFLEGDPPERDRSFEVDLSSWGKFESVDWSKVFGKLLDEFLAWAQG